MPSVVVAGPDNAATELVDEGVNGFVARLAPRPRTWPTRSCACTRRARRCASRTADWFERNAPRAVARVVARRGGRRVRRGRRPAAVNATPRVSVLIGCWNNAGTVERAARSILGQTVRELELIVVDDGSTDETPERGGRPGRRPGALLPLPHRGISPSLNDGLREARAPVVAIQDADDWSEPTRLERQLAVLDANPGAAVVGCRMHEVDERERPLAPRTSFAAGDVRPVLMRFNPIPNTCAAFRRQAALDAGGYDPRYLYAMEWDLWLRLAERHEIVTIDAPLATRLMSGANVAARRERAQIGETLSLRTRPFGVGSPRGARRASARPPCRSSRRSRSSGGEAPARPGALTGPPSSARSNSACISRSQRSSRKRSRTRSRPPAPEAGAQLRVRRQAAECLRTARARRPAEPRFPRPPPPPGCRAVGHHHRQPPPHRLEHGKREALALRGHHEGVGRGDEPGYVRAEPEHPHGGVPEAFERLAVGPVARRKQHRPSAEHAHGVCRHRGTLAPLQLARVEHGERIRGKPKLAPGVLALRRIDGLGHLDAVQHEAQAGGARGRAHRPQLLASRARMRRRSRRCGPPRGSSPGAPDALHPLRAAQQVQPLGLHHRRPASQQASGEHRRGVPHHVDEVRPCHGPGELPPAAGDGQDGPAGERSRVRWTRVLISAAGLARARRSVPSPAAGVGKDVKKAGHGQREATAGGTTLRALLEDRPDTEIAASPSPPGACPACGGGPLEPAVRHGVDRLHRTAGDFSVERCVRCGTGVTRPTAGPDELAAFYPSGYGAYELPSNPLARVASRLIRGLQARLALRGMPLGPPGSSRPPARSTWAAAGATWPGVLVEPRLERDRSGAVGGRLRGGGTRGVDARGARWPTWSSSPAPTPGRCSSTPWST